jgi:hypothetical protein
MRLVADERATSASASCSIRHFGQYSRLDHISTSHLPRLEFASARALSGNTEYAIAAIYHVFVYCNTRLAIKELVYRSAFPELCLPPVTNDFNFKFLNKHRAMTHLHSTERKCNRCCLSMDTDFSTSTKSVEGFRKQKLSAFLSRFVQSWVTGEIRKTKKGNIANLGTNWRWVVSFTPWPLYPEGKSPCYPLNRRLDGPQNRPGWRGEEKNLTLLESEHWSLGRPVVTPTVPSRLQVTGLVYKNKCCTGGN